jgi:hypothetical protein
MKKNNRYSFGLPVLLVLLVAAAPVLACSSGSSGAPAASSPTAFDALVAKYLEKCEGADAIRVREARRGQSGTLPGETFDAATVAACSRAVDAGLCDDPSCAQIYPTGTLEDGAPCRLGNQCKSALCGDGTAVCGTCTPNPACGACAAGTVCTPYGCSPLPVVAKVGERCSDEKPPLAFCARGASCDNQTGQCVENGPVGASCASSECASNAYCDFASGRCAASKGAGAKCGDLGSLECQKGLVCGAGVCKAVTKAALGQPCDEATLCDGGGCNLVAGRCEAYPKAGASCESFGYCADGALCDGKTCLTTDAYLCK